MPLLRCHRIKCKYPKCSDVFMFPHHRASTSTLNWTLRKPGQTKPCIQDHWMLLRDHWWRYGLFRCLSDVKEVRICIVSQAFHHSVLTYVPYPSFVLPHLWCMHTLLGTDLSDMKIGYKKHQDTITAVSHSSIDQAVFADGGRVYQSLLDCAGPNNCKHMGSIVSIHLKSNLAHSCTPYWFRKVM